MQIRTVRLERRRINCARPSLWGCLYVACAGSSDKLLQEKGEKEKEMLLKRKATRLSLILTVTVLSTLLLSTSVLASNYGYMWNADGWGNKIQIWISYSAYGGTVKVKATALWVGVTLFGVKLGTPIFYGESISIRIYGYSGRTLKFYKYYYSSRGWQYDKSFTFSLPSGLDAVTCYAYARFDSIPFGHSSVWCSCYAS